MFANTSPNLGATSCYTYYSESRRINVVKYASTPNFWVVNDLSVVDETTSEESINVYCLIDGNNIPLSIDRCLVLKMT